MSISRRREGTERPGLSVPPGFTLVELLIVVIILGVIAAVAIPRFAMTTEDAKEAALESDLALLRGAVERYYAEHRGVYPGRVKETDGTPTGTASEAAAAFAKQMLLYTDSQGRASAVKDATHRYGPYMKKNLPVNPYNGAGGVTCDITTADITVTAGNAADGTGWKFYVLTGRIIGNHKTSILPAPELLSI